MNIYPEKSEKLRMTKINEAALIRKESYPIRILHVLGSLDRGGAEAMIMSLYRSIDRSKVQFDFVVNDRDAPYAHEAEIEKLGGRVYRIPAYTGFNSFHYYSTWMKMLDAHPEWKVVHGHHTSPAFLYLNAAKKKNRVTIAHSHIASHGKKIKSYLKIASRFPLRYFSDYLFSCSDAAAKWMYGDKSDKAIVLKNAVDAKAAKFDVGIRKEKRQELSIENQFVVGHVGRFERQKNHDFILDIFYSIKKKRPDSVLLLVGDGSLKSHVVEKIYEMGLEDSVKLLGVRADVFELLSAMDVFLFPSLYEGLPVTMIEAQASGLMCVVSDSITIESKLTDNVKFLPLSASEDTWADMVLESQCDNRGDAYFEIAAAGYDIERNVDWLQDFYLSVVVRV